MDERGKKSLEKRITRLIDFFSNNLKKKEDLDTLKAILENISRNEFGQKIIRYMSLNRSIYEPILFCSYYKDKKKNEWRAAFLSENGEGYHIMNLNHKELLERLIMLVKSGSSHDQTKEAIANWPR